MPQVQVFCFKEVHWGSQDDKPALDVKIIPRKNSKALCSGCGRTATLYDKLKTRRFEFVPLWGYPVFFNYQMRRVNCKRCSIVVEAVPWASGKHTLTKTYMQFLEY